MGLDILTENGQEHAKHEYRAVELWNKKYPSSLYAETPKNKPASLDALLIKNNVIVAGVEQKSRNASLEQLKTWNYEWLITNQKIVDCVACTTSLGVPFFGFLYLIDSDMLLVQKIADEDGVYTVDIRRAFTNTRANINGGSIVRENAYVDMSKALIIS